MHRPLICITASHSPNAVADILGAEEDFSTESAVFYTLDRIASPHRLGLDGGTATPRLTGPRKLDREPTRISN